MDNNTQNQNQNQFTPLPPQVIKLKLAVLGKSLVGKSCMTNVFINQKFSIDYDATIEDKYVREKLIDGKQCSLDILDTAGQDDYASLINTWISSSDGFILVFSITDRESFEGVKGIYKKIVNIKGNIEDFRIILAGNKSDIQDDRVVSNEEAMDLAISWGSDYVECSAKTMTNVEKAFVKVSEKLLNKMFKADEKEDKNKKKTCFCF